MALERLQRRSRAASQSLTVLSSDADATSLPSGEKATALTELEWPSSVCSAAPVAASQSLTVSSSDADATSLPSGEKATALTQPEWPSSVDRQGETPASTRKCLTGSLLARIAICNGLGIPAFSSCCGISLPVGRLPWRHQTLLPLEREAEIAS